VQPDDIAILLRSPGPVRHYYTMALEEQQVAWSAEGGEDFFQTTEISVALSWLQIIDNPRQDIPLLSVLRSPVCGFTPDRLAEIRGLGQGDFYTALQGAAEEGWEDCSAFLEDLEALRFGAGEKSSYALLWDLYRRTDLVEIFSAMPGGEKRRENLMAFYDLARRFEGAGHKGLFSFLLHLNRVQERGGVKTPPAAPQETAGVKLLSIHRSKGLEYPVVFLCGLGRQFNTTDLQQSGVLVHPKLGLGPKGVDGETRVKFSTLARTGVSLALKKELLAEEMRLLYVAMTRAKDKLILTHTLSRGKSDLEKAADGMGSPIAPQVLAGCTSPGQWVLLTAMARPEGQALRQGAGWSGGPVSAQGLGPAWRIEYHQGEVSQEVSRRVRQREEGEDLPPEELARELTWRYPYAVASATPAKVTATQVTQEVGEEPGVFLLGEKDREILFDRPQFAQETLGLTPAQRGTALHTAMQCVDLDRTGSQEELRRELDRLTRDKYLTPLQAQAVDVGAMARFFSSDLGRQLRQSPAARREYPFSLLAPARNFYPQAPEGEEILLQGVVDCWFETLEGITIVDFKTDRVSRAQALDRARSYAGQLAAYAYALEQITGKKVARKALWFLGPAIAVDL
jgi:ATP-dependent helicase/nuclease subunit A